MPLKNGDAVLGRKPLAHLMKAVIKHFVFTAGLLSLISIAYVFGAFLLLATRGHRPGVEGD
jgi:hypothetical protein